MRGKPCSVFGSATRRRCHGGCPRCCKRFTVPSFERMFVNMLSKYKYRIPVPLPPSPHQNNTWHSSRRGGGIRLQPWVLHTDHIRTLSTSRLPTKPQQLGLSGLCIPVHASLRSSHQAVLLLQIFTTSSPRWAFARGGSWSTAAVAPKIPRRQRRLPKALGRRRC